LRDPTRGGLSSTLNEFAVQSHVGIVIEETAIPVREGVKGACELLGLDPLYVANEGKLVAIVAPGLAAKLLAAMRAHPLGSDAQIIGTVAADQPGLVTMRTPLGTTRIVDMLSGDQLPRIC
jgi:hydrogenase expression/formation protein HypE